MGNRGDLHARDGSLGRMSCQQRAWIICELLPGIPLRIGRPGSYYPLFFLDEAVALAAGHRPCAHCRSARLKAFKEAWRLAFRLGDSEQVSLPTIDQVLNSSRQMQRSKELSADDLVSLPSGVFVGDAGGASLLRTRDGIRTWDWQGYGSLQKLPLSGVFRLITPLPLVQVIACGYDPVLHPSAN